MHPKTSKFKLTTSRLRWMRSLAAVCIASMALFIMVPLLTQANLLDRPVKE